MLYILTNMNAQSLPLYQLFNRLRHEGFSLGVSEYNLLLEVLLIEEYSESFSLSTLKDICQAIWVKSWAEKQKFETVFQELFVFPETKNKPAKQIKLVEVTREIDTTSKSDKSDKIIEESETDDNEIDEYFYFSPQSESSQFPDKEKDIVTALKTGKIRDWTTFKSSRIADEYLPATAEQIQQGWYQLHQPIALGNRRELDLEATIREIQRRGKYQPPIIKSSQVRSQLVLFLDQRGSMQPFHVLSRLLKETAIRVGCLRPQNCYYFYNYPINELYNDPDFMQAVPLSQMMANLHPKRTMAIIFSDGGAAKGHYSLKRWEATQKFIAKIRSQVHSLCWLNPLPESYWKGTTAQEINETIIPMFPLDKKGFNDVIKQLEICYK
ncbi:hypothetical protein [Aphanothece sacrum]|uniref:VWA containing CoxE family protein n=1 Tax=Aphanothece sacrum FPU1 TaxID=1920663 RepID=A0A401IIU9_APHSA|nr:hypothetical protein [Aphanothece sacrum]GBF81154.1 VWA containing CoxE family protein [Aphanothece sacrum FPU1]GBF83498.1 hypothetical protein AsFPU3_0540 [Aphanothece sacrum FPU3]